MKWKFFIGRRRGRKLLVKEKDCNRQGHFPLGGKAGGLMQITSSSLGDKEDPGDRLPHSLVLIRKFLTKYKLKLTFLVEVETAVRLGITPQLGDLASVMPCGAFILFFF